MGIESQYLGEINIPEEQRAEYAQQALKLLRAGGMVLKSFFRESLCK